MSSSHLLPEGGVSSDAKVGHSQNGASVSIRGKACQMFSFLGIQQGSKIDCFLCRFQWLKFDKIVST